jgi:hypothetical protein
MDRGVFGGEMGTGFGFELFREREESGDERSGMPFLCTYSRIGAGK